jgi:hypothetical protein
MKPKPYAFPKSGRCRVCGCTDDRACEGGCFWVDKDDTLCSTCAGTRGDLAATLRDIAARLSDELHTPRRTAGRKLWIEKAIKEANKAIVRYKAFPPGVTCELRSGCDLRDLDP